MHHLNSVVNVFLQGMVFVLNRRRMKVCTKNVFVTAAYKKANSGILEKGLDYSSSKMTNVDICR